jgi:hypothetical protein
MSESINIQDGLPVYVDVERKLANAVEVDDSTHDWLPGNRAAHKLHRCFECLLNIDELLEDAAKLKNPVKQRRRIKILFTHLHSFAECLLDLLNDCEANPDTVQKMPKGGTKLISQMRQLLLSQVPIGKDGLLSKLRDKTSAHIDKSLWVNESRDLVKKAKPHDVGLWLDVCIGIQCDLLKLPIYFWSVDSNQPDVVRIVMCEPFLVSMRIKDGKISELVGMHVIKQSPRKEIEEIILKVIKHSRWMFRPGDKQIRSVYYDEKDASWAQSLINLQEIKKC